MKLRRFCVTVMDHWTPTREFFTYSGALAFACQHRQAAFMFVWNQEQKTWEKVQRVWLTNIHDR